MDWDARQFFESVISIFAIVNPIGNLPVFVGLTEHVPPADRRRVFRLAGLVALGIILAMALVGQVLMDKVFHINVEKEFAFGGGVLLIIIGAKNLVGNGHRKTAEPAALPEDRHSEEIRLAVTPIASPLLVGPGSIVTVMLIASDPHQGKLYALGASVAAFAAVILVLNYAHVLNRVMGRVGSLAVGRVMQIFIVALGVKFCYTALLKMVPAIVDAAGK